MTAGHCSMNLLIFLRLGRGFKMLTLSLFVRTVSTSASCALAAPRRARATGGTEIDTLDLLSSCRHTG